MSSDPTPSEEEEKRGTDAPRLSEGTTPLGNPPKETLVQMWIAKKKSVRLLGTNLIWENCYSTGRQWAKSHKTRGKVDPNNQDPVPKKKKATRKQKKAYPSSRKSKSEKRREKEWV